MPTLARWRHVRRGTTQRLPASGSHGVAHAARPAAPFAARLCTDARQDERQSFSNVSLKSKDDSCNAVFKLRGIDFMNRKTKI